MGGDRGRGQRERDLESPEAGLCADTREGSGRRGQRWGGASRRCRAIPGLGAGPRRGRGVVGWRCARRGSGLRNPGTCRQLALRDQGFPPREAVLLLHSCSSWELAPGKSGGASDREPASRAPGQ